MAIQLMSNVKIITSGAVPTTANLLPGQAAFGKITSDGKYHLFGNTGEGGAAGKVVDIVLDTYSGVDAYSLEQVLTQGNTSKLNVVFTDEDGVTKVTIGAAGLTLGETSVKEDGIKVKGKDVLSASLTTLSDDDATAMRGLLKVYSKTEIDGMLAGVYHMKGSVANFAALPTDAKVGDVYNVKAAGGTDIHGTPVKAGDNVVYVAANGDDPAGWDVLSGVVDLSAYYTSAQVDALLADYAKSADVYTKTAANEKFLAKADAETTYATKTEAYTKTEATEAHSTMNAAITKAQGDATAAGTAAANADKKAAGAQTAAEAAQTAADAAQTDATKAIDDAAAAKTQADKGVKDAATAQAAAEAAQTTADTANTEIGKTNARVKTLEDAGYQTAADVNQILTDGNYVKDAAYVHTDKNYTAADQTKVGKIIITGDGSKVLKDDGSYDTLELSVVSI